MVFNLKLVKVDSKYCDYLRKFDNKVPYNKDKKELRPFVGVLFNIGKIEYFAPLTSPKTKHLKMHNTLDFFKIDNGNLGAINFNNMIPVKENNYTVIKLFNENDSYDNLLRDQYSWLNSHVNELRNKSFKLYDLYNNNKLSDNIKNRCCNFKMLEDKCNDYK